MYIYTCIYTYLYIIYLFRKYLIQAAAFSKEVNWNEIPEIFTFHVETGFYFKASIQIEY